MEFCPACYPLKVRSHFNTYLEDIIDVLLIPLWGQKPKAQLPRFPWWMSATHFWYRALEVCRVIRFTDVIDKKDHWPRSWTIIDEAQRRGIPIEAVKIFGRVAT